VCFTDVRRRRNGIVQCRTTRCQSRSKLAWRIQGARANGLVVRATAPKRAATVEPDGVAPDNEVAHRLVLPHVRAPAIVRSSFPRFARHPGGKHCQWALPDLPRALLVSRVIGDTHRDVQGAVRAGAQIQAVGGALWVQGRRNFRTSRSEAVPPRSLGLRRPPMALDVG
jgi:hypothetical protein